MIPDLPYLRSGEGGRRMNRGSRHWNIIGGGTDIYKRRYIDAGNRPKEGGLGLALFGMCIQVFFHGNKSVASDAL